MPLALFAQSVGLQSPCTGISFVDSTTLDVCDSHRIWQNKVFKGVAQRGKSSTGWHYGFKLPLVIHDRGEIPRFCLILANVDDRNQKVMESLTKNCLGSFLQIKGMCPKNCLKGFWTKAWSWSLSRKRTSKNQGRCASQIGFFCESAPWSSR